MQIAILCPGPSLARHEADAWKAYDLTIAVNRAASAHPCDWWVFGDAEGFRQTMPKGHPKVFTTKQSWAEVNRGGLGGGWWARFFEEMHTDIVLETNWRRHSMTAAMVLGYHLFGLNPRNHDDSGGAIDIFGCDWAVEADYFDGGKDTIGHHSNRFDRERHAYGRIVDRIASKGIEVRRAKFDYAGMGNE